MIRRPPSSPLFPYTPLFRSIGRPACLLLLPVHSCTARQSPPRRLRPMASARIEGKEGGLLMSRWIGLIGVPSIAGAHWPGQEKAPRVIAGLVERLRAAGMTVIDYCDMPCSRWYPDREHRRPHNLAAVVEVARGAADLVEAALQDSETPLVIGGGDRTIELGVLSGFLRRNVDVGLLYFDGGVDLLTPL